MGYRPEIDGLRGIAVIVVVVYHVGGVMWPSAASWLLPGGMLGVDLFFVLSGFLITSLLVHEHQVGGHIGLVAFARRRVLRLVPAMSALLLVALGLALAGRVYEVGDVVSTAGWSLTFTANWAMLDGRPVVMGHLWSVAIEGQFYLVWAVVVVVAMRFRHHAAVLVCTAVAGIVAVAWWRHVEAASGANLFLVYLGTLTRFDAPLVGAVAGVLSATGRLDRLRAPVASALAVAGLVVLLASAAGLEGLDPALYHGLFTVVAVAAACAVVGATRSGQGAVVVRVLAARPLVVAGMISYSLYLWHLPVFEWLSRETPSWSPAVRTLVGVLAAVAAATVSYVCIERPFLRRRYRRRARATA